MHRCDRERAKVAEFIVVKHVDGDGLVLVCLCCVVDGVRALGSECNNLFRVIAMVRRRGIANAGDTRTELQMSKIVDAEVLGGVEDELDRAAEIIALANALRSEVDANVEWARRPEHVVAVAEVDHCVGCDLIAGDQVAGYGMRRGEQRAELRLIVLEEQAAQVARQCRAVEHVHGELDVAVDLGCRDLHAGLARNGEADLTRAECVVERCQRCRQLRCELQRSVCRSRLRFGCKNRRYRCG
jgi:hypothetical protein